MRTVLCIALFALQINVKAAELDPAGYTKVPVIVPEIIKEMAMYDFDEDDSEEELRKQLSEKLDEKVDPLVREANVLPELTARAIFYRILAGAQLREFNDPMRATLVKFESDSSSYKDKLSTFLGEDLKTYYLQDVEKICALGGSLKETLKAIESKEDLKLAGELTLGLIAFPLMFSAIGIEGLIELAQRGDGPQYGISRSAEAEVDFSDDDQSEKSFALNVAMFETVCRTVEKTCHSYCSNDSSSANYNRSCFGNSYSYDCSETHCSERYDYSVPMTIAYATGSTIPFSLGEYMQLGLFLSGDSDSGTIELETGSLMSPFSFQSQYSGIPLKVTKKGVGFKEEDARDKKLTITLSGFQRTPKTPGLFEVVEAKLSTDHKRVYAKVRDFMVCKSRQTKYFAEVKAYRNNNFDKTVIKKVLSADEVNIEDGIISFELEAKDGKALPKAEFYELRFSYQKPGHAKPSAQKWVPFK